MQVVQESVLGERRQQHGVALARLRRVAHAARHRAPTAPRRASAAPYVMSPRYVPLLLRRSRYASRRYGHRRHRNFIQTFRNKVDLDFTMIN